MATIKKQPKSMFYVPGIIAIGIGIAVLGIETPDRTIRFGADFYTETYQAIAEVAYVIKTVTAYALFALGTLSLGKGMTEAKRSDLVLEELGEIREALEEIKAHKTVDVPVEPTSEVLEVSEALEVPEVPEAVIDAPSDTAPVEPIGEASVEPSIEVAEAPQEELAADPADQVDTDTE